MQREVLVDAAQTSDEVVLKSANRALGRIATMDVGRHELKIDVFGAEEFLEDRRALIVEALELGAKASFAKLGVDGLECREDGLGGPCFHWFGKDAIAVVVVKDKQVVVAIAGGGHELAGLISVDLTSWFERGDEAVVGWFGSDETGGVIIFGVVGRCWNHGRFAAGNRCFR